jgi:caa(3)-type oxidase subunit IV
MTTHELDARHALKKYVLTYVALLVLATLSWLLAVVHVPGGVIFGMLIGAIKAVLVLAFFMHLAEEAFSFKLVIAVSAILVLIFVGLTVVDPLTRTPQEPAPATAASSYEPRP